MFSIENALKIVKQLDNLLTAITKLIKKHWLILIVIALIALGYWIYNLPEVPVDQVVPSQVDSTAVDSTAISK